MGRMQQLQSSQVLALWVLGSPSQTQTLPAMSVQPILTNSVIFSDFFPPHTWSFFP